MEAGALVIESGQASISMLQRRLKIGYTRAARMIDQLEDRNIVGAYQGSKARQVLVGWDEFQRIFNQEDEE
jgi:S-DNA-T family DNA segregation ATPase FtsK/SpoIIIE